MAVGSVLAWLILSLVLLVLGAPIAAAIFPRLADRGASVALPLVLTIVFYMSYYGGRLSLELALLGAISIVGLAAAFALQRGVSVRWARVAEVGAIFAIAYVFLVVVRATDPAILAAGGEKFLDFGLLKSLLRTATVPPPDFWYAGEPVLYYYGGHLLVSQGIRLLGTTPGVAYNLALSAVFAGYVSAAYGLAGNISARTGRFDRRAALFGGFFIGWASNLFTPLRVLLRPLPDDIAASLARSLDVWAGRYGREGAVVTDAQPFSMWDATGVIDGAIHEMPLFAFVNGDLHAHMMAPAFTLLLASALLAYWRTPSTDRRRRLGLLFGLVPAIGGVLAVVNTWSFFATGGLTALTLLFDGDIPELLPARYRFRLDSPDSVRARLTRLGGALVGGFSAGVLAGVLSAPFWLGNVGSRAVGFLPDRSSTAALVVVHGTFLVPIAGYFAYSAWARYDLSWRDITVSGLVFLAALALASVVDLAVLGLIAPFLLVGYLLGDPPSWLDSETVRDRAKNGTTPGFELVPILGALGLVLLVEFVYLIEHAGAGRFNTVFKMYAQVWALFAVGTAASLGRLFQLAQNRRPITSWPSVLRVGVALLLIATSIYGGLAVTTEVDSAVTGETALSLDGTAWLEDRRPIEARAITWLDERDGIPVTLTRPGVAYRWPGAVSVFTGLPTVIGWQHHERGFGRSPAAVAARAADVDTIYTGPADRQRALLAAYNVRFVYVGPAERQKYGENLVVSRLDQLVRERTFGDGTVVIYRVTDR
ncbi:MAG: DUF2298 domain-containing protein [Salinirussus sp.]